MGRCAAAAVLVLAFANCVPDVLTLSVTPDASAPLDSDAPAPLPETGIPLDAGGDNDIILLDSNTPVPLDAAEDIGTTWCKTLTPAPPLCMDFDESLVTVGFADGGLVGVGGLSVGEGGSVSLTPDASSPPGALLAKTTQVASGGSEPARFVNPLTLSNVDGVAIAFAMNYQRLTGTTGRIIIATLILNGATEAKQVAGYFTLEPNGIRLGLSTPGGGYASNVVALLPTNKWVQVRVVLTLSPTELALYVGGAANPSGTVTVPGVTQAFSPPATGQLIIGIGALGPVAPATVALDNVVFGPT